MYSRYALGIVASLAVFAAPSGAGEPPRPTRPELVVQLGHPTGVLSSRLSRDGKYVVTAGQDNTACLWDVETAREVRRFRGHTGMVFAVHFSADGKRVLTGAYDRTARLWDTATGKELRRFAGDAPLLCVALSADGSRVLTGGQEGARVWDAATGQEVCRFRGLPKGANSAAFSSDGKQALIGGLDKVASLWDAATGKELRRFEGHPEIVSTVAFSENGDRVLTVANTTTRVWDAATGKELRRLEGAGFRASISPDGKWVVAVAKDVIQFWEVASGKAKLPESRRGVWAGSLVLSVDGNGWLTSDWPSRPPPGFRIGTTRLISPPISAGVEIRRFEGQVDKVIAVALTPDGRRLLVASLFGPVRLLDLANGKELVLPREWPVGQVASLSADGKRVVTGNRYGTFALWDSETGKELRRFTRPGGERVFAALSPDGKYLVTGEHKEFQANARQWATGGGDGFAISVFPGTTCLTWSPDGTRQLAGSEAKIAELRNVGPQYRRSQYFKHDGAVTAVAVSPDNKRSLTGSADKLVRLWDNVTGKEVARFQGHEYSVTAVAFAADGKRVLTGSWDQTARLWDAATGKELRRFEGHRGAVVCVSFAPSGKQVLTGSADGTARLWDAATGKEVVQFVNGRNGLLAVTPEGHYLAPRTALDTVAFRVGNRALPFGQFDLRFNRPDLVLARLGCAPRELIEMYQRAYQRRLRRFGVTEAALADEVPLPRVTAAVDARLSASATVGLKVKAADPSCLLDRLSVHVNGVPVSLKGAALRERKVKTWQQDLTIDLSYGENVIQVSARNEKGVESLQETVRVSRPRMIIDGPPTLYAVVVGVSDYRDARLRLTYADKDARDLAAFFDDIAVRQAKLPKELQVPGTIIKRFEAVKTLRILNRDATRENILKAKEFLRPAKVNDLVIVFFAGHGLLDAKLNYWFGTADIDFRDPAKRGLGYEDIEGLLEAGAARRRLLLMDTCHSGEAEREDGPAAAAVKVPEGTVRARPVRGFRPLEDRQVSRDESQILLEETFADLRRGSGAVVIAASGAAEYALESAQWKNGVFTYAVLRALRSGRADRNRDGDVQVSELRDFVLEEVRRLTGGRQRPTVRRENFEFDFALTAGRGTLDGPAPEKD